MTYLSHLRDTTELDNESRWTASEDISTEPKDGEPCTSHSTTADPSVACNICDADKSFYAEKMRASRESWICSKCDWEVITIFPKKGAVSGLR